MRKIPSILIIILSLSLLPGYTAPKGQAFVSPINYKSKLIIRCDRRGEGFFGAERRGGRRHSGIDLYARIGTPVLASRSGKVITVKTTPGMGRQIVIQHKGGYTSVYGHLNKMYVKRGQYVSQGKKIGTVGRTGNARYSGIQPHLHFEIRKKGIPKDPLVFIIDKSKSREASIKISLQNLR